MKINNKDRSVSPDIVTIREKKFKHVCLSLLHVFMLSIFSIKEVAQQDACDKIEVEKLRQGKKSKQIWEP